MQTSKRLAIFGSRTLSDERVIELIMEKASSYGADCIVTAAEPAGVCAVAQLYAKCSATPLKLHFLNVEHKAAGAWHHRSVAVLNDCDFLLIIHDGVSKGTANEVALAVKMGIQHEYKVLAKV
jgi:hypothetical protein